MISWILIFIGIMVVLCLVVSAWDCNRFVTVEYEITSDKVIKPCRMVLLSDQHNKEFGKENARLLEKIDGISPDGILVAGDMLTAERGKSFQPALRLMHNLAQKYKLYYGMGNHEYRLRLYPEQYNGMYERYMEGLAAAGIRPLINEQTYLPEFNISVCGLEMDRHYYGRFGKQTMDTEYLSRILGEAAGDSFQILIAHNPDYFEQYAAWGADLTVSGHVHGGIMKLPFLGGVLSPNLTLFPKYDGGKYEFRGANMVLSRGLGTHTLPLRIFNPGELVVINILPAN